MAPHFLTIPAELRLKICKFALVGTVHVVDLWEQYDENVYFLEDYDATGDLPAPQYTTSLLRVCRQVQAEVSPFFHNYVRLHFRSKPFAYDVEVEELVYLLRQDVSILYKAADKVQSISIPLELPYRPLIDWVEPKELTARLPHLKTLIVYDHNEAETVRSRIYPTNNEESKKRFISFIDRQYEGDRPGYTGLRRLAHGEGRTYTIIHQEFFDEKEVSTDFNFPLSAC